MILLFLLSCPSPYLRIYRIGEKEYYDNQFATLKSFEEVDSLVASDSVYEEDLEEQAQHERAMKISNYANILLLAFKVMCYFLYYTTFQCYLKELISKHRFFLTEIVQKNSCLPVISCCQK